MVMDKKYFEDLIEKDREERGGGGKLETFNVILGGAITAVGAIGATNGKNPIVKTIGIMALLFGTLNTASGGFYLGRNSLLEDLKKEAPETVVEPETEE